VHLSTVRLPGLCKLEAPGSSPTRAPARAVPLLPIRAPMSDARSYPSMGLVGDREMSLFVDAKSVRGGYGSGSSPGSSEPKPGPRVTRRRRERDLPAFPVSRLFRKDLRQVRALPPISPVRRRQSGVRVRPSCSGSDPRVFGAKLSLSLVTSYRRVSRPLSERRRHNDAETAPKRRRAVGAAETGQLGQRR